MQAAKRDARIVVGTAAAGRGDTAQHSGRIHRIAHRRAAKSDEAYRAAELESMRMTLSVTTASGSGSGSLTQAASLVGAGGTISLSASLAGQVITSSAALPA